jgi:arylsulfatase
MCPHFRPELGLLTAGLILASCSRSDTPPPQKSVSDLLIHGPQEIRATDSHIVPSDFDQWGPHDGGGWNINTPVRDQTPCVVTQAPKAALILRAASSRNRTLSLVGWGVDAPTEVELTLNRIAIGTVTLGRRSTTVQVETPGALWRVGDNHLELEPRGDMPRIAIASIDIAPLEGVHAAENGVELSSRTSATWQLELGDQGLLDYELSGGLTETCTIKLSALTPGEISREVLEERTVEFTSATPVVGRLLLPRPEGRVLEFSVSNDSLDSKDPILLSKLELYEERPLERPPILFISIDTLSAKNMSIFGYERETTPRLAELVEDSVLFEQTRSNAPWTIPSYTSQFTGVYARANKQPDSTAPGSSHAWQLFTLPERRWTLTEMLRAAGYRTAGFVDNLWLTRVPGFAQGFDVFDATAALIKHEEPQGGMRTVLPLTAKFLAENRREPVFAFAQIVDVHGPYRPAAPFKGRFSEQLDPASTNILPIVQTSPAVFGGIPDVVVRPRLEGQSPRPTQIDAELVRADYDEKILELDDELGKFFDDLKQRGLYDDLLIIFSADHGESMVDHDFLFHHGLVYDSAIHVPLLIKFPGSRHGGERISDHVQLIDLYPTILDVLGLPSERPSLHGRSLLPLVEGAKLPDVPLFSQADILEQAALSHGPWKLIAGTPNKTHLETLLTHEPILARLRTDGASLFTQVFGADAQPTPNVITARLKALREEGSELESQLWRFVHSGPPLIELYNTDQDPFELVDLADKHPDIVDRLLAEIDSERARVEALQLENEGSTLEVSDEMLDELRRLGYVGND